MIGRDVTAWMGQLPQHWEVRPLKSLFEVVGGSTPKSDNGEYWDGDIVWVTPSDLDDKQIVPLSRSLRKITDQGLASCGTTLVPAGSIVLSTRAPIGSLGLAQVQLCTNQGCKSLVPSASSFSRYFAYVLSATTEELRTRGKGTTFLELSSDELGAFRVPAPPLEEQTAIAAFLDRETGKIDVLVDEQRRLIELLKEQRQAIISHAVTKGLDPTVKTRPSGVEWLGDVPAHWEVHPLKYVARLESGGTPNKANPDYWDGDVPWASAKDLKSDVLSTTQDFITQAALQDGAASLVESGSVVVLVRGMMLARTFPVVLLNMPMAINQDLKALSSKVLRGDFMAWTLRGTEAQTLSRLDEAGHGTKALRMEAWTSMEVPVPPSSEQHAIADYLSGYTQSIDELVRLSSASIDLLNERRSALISAAVTGKIDVATADDAVEAA